MREIERGCRNRGERKRHLERERNLEEGIEDGGREEVKDKERRRTEKKNQREKGT